MNIGVYLVEKCLYGNYCVNILPDLCGLCEQMFSEEGGMIT